MMKVIDVKGKACPLPLVATKKALKEGSKDELIKIIIDSETSLKNVMRYLKDNGIKVKQQNVGDSFELIFNKDGEEPVIEEAEAYCAGSESDDQAFVVVFGKDRLGEGSEDLGKMLVGGMLTTLVEEERTPDKIIFLNSGINLVLDGSPVLNLLIELETKGSELLSCGACLDYFDEIKNLKAGRVSNMVEILEILTFYSKVINI